MDSENGLHSNDESSCRLGLGVVQLKQHVEIRLCCMASGIVELVCMHCPCSCSPNRMNRTCADTPTMEPSPMASRYQFVVQCMRSTGFRVV